MGRIKTECKTYGEYLRSQQEAANSWFIPLTNLPRGLADAVKSSARFGVVPYDNALSLGQDWWDKNQGSSCKEEQIREKEKTMMEKAKDQLGKTGEKLVDAGSEGLKLAGAKRVGRTLTKVARRHLGGMHPAIFDTEIGKRVEPMVIAAGVHYVLGMYPDKIPQAANLQRNCERIVTAEMEDVGGDLMDVIMPLLMELASSVPVLGETVEAEFAEEAPAPKKVKK